MLSISLMTRFASLTSVGGLEEIIERATGSCDALGLLLLFGGCYVVVGNLLSADCCRRCVILAMIELLHCPQMAKWTAKQFRLTTATCTRQENKLAARVSLFICSIDVKLLVLRTKHGCATS